MMTKSHKITLTNDFHNTEITVLVPATITDQREAWYQIQYAADDARGTDRPAALAKLNLIRRTLCGSKNCQCGIVR